MQPQAPAPGEVELDDAGVPLPGLLLLAGGVVGAEGGHSTAKQRDGAVEERGRDLEEAADDRDGVARVEERFGERRGEVVAGGRNGGGGEREEVRVGAERGAAGEEAREGGSGGEAAVERHGGCGGSGGGVEGERLGCGGLVYI